MTPKFRAWLKNDKEMINVTKFIGLMENLIFRRLYYVCTKSRRNRTYAINRAL